MGIFRKMFKKVFWTVFVLIFFAVAFFIFKLIWGGIAGEGEYACLPKENERVFSTGPYYDGPLIDSHVHMPVASKIVSTISEKAGFANMPAYDKDFSIDYIACLFEREGITKAFGFNVVPKYLTRKSLKKVLSNEKRHGEKFVHFFQPTPLASLNQSVEKIDDILTKNADVFKGYGEVKFAFNEIENQGIVDEHYLKSYALADKHKTIIMMHPGRQHEEQVKFILEKHPNLNFLFHGGEIREWIFDVLKEYENAFYSVEPNNYIFGWSEGDHYKDNPTKDEFLAYMELNYEQTLQQELAFWRPIINAQPDKFLWGTDRWYRWHFDEQVGGWLEEFGRAFIGNLNQSIQEDFAHRNAQRILQK